MFDLEKVLLEICDGDEDVLKENIDLIESGYLDSYAFILLFEALEDAGINISPTQIKKDDLRSLKRLKEKINNYVNKEVVEFMEKIPSRQIPDAYYEYDFIESPLVEIPNDVGIIIDLQYPLMGCKSAIKKCLVRKEVLERLLEAKSYLPEGITFKIWDAYRPLALQKELFYAYKDKIIKEFNLMKKTEEERNKIINSYVALPNEDETFPPQHTTGGAIDLTLAYIDSGKILDLGIPFDSFSDLTNTAAFEKEGMDENVRTNRRLLYNAMTKAGFTNLPSECWHYDYGNRNWAFYNNKPAIYKGVFDFNDVKKKN